MKYLMLFFLFYCQALFAKEELVVIQTVSVDQKSFVISKGIKDGIIQGQELIFANENVSLVCKAVEVNRNYSYWYPVNDNMTVPFLREEIVSAISHIYGSIELNLLAHQGDLITTMEHEKEIKEFRRLNHFSLRGSIGLGITQSSSSVSTEQNSRRLAYDVALEYDKRLQPEYEIGVGMRVDNDIYRLSDPTLDIPTTRVMAIAVATYHFINWSHDKNNAYISLVGGIGYSKTVVNETVSSGTATILPQVRLGYIMPFSKTSAMIFEASMESISSSEQFSDTTKQTAGYFNVKGTIGIAF
jgi:hypothetical protein